MIADILTDPDLVRPVETWPLHRQVDGRGRSHLALGEMTILAAAIQPSSPREREALPEADREAAAITLWTLAAIAPDTVVRWNGAGWLVRSVEFWPDGARPHRRAVAVQDEGLDP
ncbi:MAG: hypothetical protein LAT81_15595 [Oceanicaulis sp.]|nr:hypothetical protein [Oceanicaulis sp.]